MKIPKENLSNRDGTFSMMALSHMRTFYNGAYWGMKIGLDNEKDLEGKVDQIEKMFDIYRENIDEVGKSGMWDLLGDYVE